MSTGFATYRPCAADVAVLTAETSRNMRLLAYLGLRPHEAAPPRAPWWTTAVAAIGMVVMIKLLHTLAVPGWLAWPVGLVAFLAAVALLSRQRRGPHRGS